MQLNHANLPVPDVVALRDFLIRHFGFTATETRSGDKFSVLEGSGGFVLILQQTKEPFPKSFHIGFYVDTPALVQEKHVELTAAQAQPGPIEQLTRGRYTSVTFYCEAHGLLIEVTSPVAVA